MLPRLYRAHCQGIISLRPGQVEYDIHIRGFDKLFNAGYPAKAVLDGGVLHRSVTISVTAVTVTCREKIPVKFL
jgi:hypothetical protein